MTAGAGDLPVRPRNLRATFERLPDSLELRIPYHYFGQTLFFSIWLTGWTLGCVLLAYEAATKFEPITILFCVPFWASWWLGAGILFGSLWRCDSLRLNAEGLFYEMRVIKVLKRCFIPLAELKAFRAYRGPSDEDNCYQEGMETIGAGRNLRFAESLSKKEIEWLVALLNSKLSELSERSGQGWKEGADLAVTDDPPPESRMAVVHEDGDVVFREIGVWNWQVIGFALFVALFVNGILSVFLGGLLGWGSTSLLGGFPTSVPVWWGFFLFLIPFEIGGFCAIGYLLMQLLEPRRVTIWRFSARAVETGTLYWGIGRSKRFDLSTAREIQICERPRHPVSLFGKPLLKQHPGDPDGTQFAVSLLDGSERELCAMTELTLAEAHWIRRHLTRMRNFTERIE